MVTFLYTASSYGDNWRVNRIDMLTKNGLLMLLSRPQPNQKWIRYTVYLPISNNVI